MLGWVRVAPERCSLRLPPQQAQCVGIDTFLFLGGGRVVLVEDGDGFGFLLGFPGAIGRGGLQLLGVRLFQGSVQSFRGGGDALFFVKRGW